MRLDVIGGRGFLGHALIEAAERFGFESRALTHAEALEANIDVGVYCSGIAWGADARALEAYRLHAVVPLQILAKERYRRFVYVSSTRVYEGASATSEATPLLVHPNARADAYRQSKISGELGVMAASPEHLVVRCSNLAGASPRSMLFLSDILRQANQTGAVRLRSSLESSKDYVVVDDAADAIVQLVIADAHGIWNVAAGRNTSHRELLDAIAVRHPITINVPSDAPTLRTPPIDVTRLAATVDWSPRSVLDGIAGWYDVFGG
jgi:nucleoside-diphosphate-sugar epimerase